MVDRSKLHPLLRKPVEVRQWVRGLEHPKHLLDMAPDNPEHLLSIAHHHVVSARQFDRELLVQLCRLAAFFESTPSMWQKPLQDRILISAFHEPSTRTRISFESAWHRLGGEIMSITDPNTTGIAKGESLRDVAEMFSNYGDVMVLRDSDENSVYEMLKTLRIPIINAGNGLDEHPTQALADVYSIFKWRPQLTVGQSQIQLGIIGTPSRMRTVRSLLLFSALLKDVIQRVVIVTSADEVFDEGQREELEAAGLTIDVTDRLDHVLPELDVVYINSIAWVKDGYEEMNQRLGLNASSPLKEGAIILHPLARGKELDEDLDDTAHNWYFSQARGAVYVRMALLTVVAGRAHWVEELDPQTSSIA